MEKLTYQNFKEKMYEYNDNYGYTHKGTKTYLKGVIVFTKDSFIKEYSLEERSYLVTSDNKAFLPNMGGYSIFGDSLDNSDIGVRLEQVIDVECGDKQGWHVDYCYLLEECKR